MSQTPMLDGLAFNKVSFGQYIRSPAEVGIRRGHSAESLVIAVMVVVFDEGADLSLKVTRQEVVFKQYPVLQGLVPALDLALGLRMIGRAADVFHVLVP